MIEDNQVPVDTANQPSPDPASGPGNTTNQVPPPIPEQQPPIKTPRFGKKKWLAAAIIIVAVLGLYFGVVHKSKKSTTANAPTKVYHVGILCGLEFFCKTEVSFKAKMTELGYIEGKNISYDYQQTNFEPAKEKAILAKFVSDKVDLIVTFPTEVTLAAKAAKAGTNIPLVFGTASTEGVDLIKSVGEPGNNITGVRYPGSDLAVKRLQTMHEIVPNAKRILIAYQKGYPTVPAELQALAPAAKSLGVTLTEAAFASPVELQAYLDAKPKTGDTGVDAILMISETLAVTPDSFSALCKFATDHKIVLGGAIVSIGGCDSIYGIDINPTTVGTQAAPIADKIFKGTPAGSIPVVTAERYLQINYKAAQAQGITISDSLLGAADEVIR